MTDFIQELKSKAGEVRDYIINSPFQENISPAYIKDGALLYTKRGGKMLRPAILLWACEAVGGDPSLALPAAAAIEISHTWTLVHDDIIDNDDLRRGGPSVHSHYREHFKDLVDDPGEREEVARSQAILVGDLQQSWATSLLNELGEKIDPKLFRFLLRDLTVNWAPKVLNGQALDVEYSKLPLSEVTEDMILDMLSLKTASTFAFAGKAGAMIGLNQSDPNHSMVRAMEKICMNAGIAFQLKDDVLGVVGEEQELGKPVGSDIREGKRTLITAHAYRHASSEQKQLIDEVLGNDSATSQEIDKLKQLMEELGSLEYVTKLAHEYTDKAQAELKNITDSQAKRLLEAWINFIIERSY